MGLSKEQKENLQEAHQLLTSRGCVVTAKNLKRLNPEAFEPQPVEFSRLVLYDKMGEVLLRTSLNGTELELGYKYNWKITECDGYQMLAAYEKTDK